MNNAGLEALAGRGGTSPAKASSPALFFHYPLSIILGNSKITPLKLKVNIDLEKLGKQLYFSINHKTK
jgi:hypothetical protein